MKHLHRLRVAHRLTPWIVALAAIASGAGLFLPAVYRETAWVVPQNRGQDLVTLVALAVLVTAWRAARDGSLRSTLIWLGLLGYLAYTYTGAAFAYGFNVLFLVYVALFSMTGAALIAGLSRIDAAALHAAFDARTPRRSVAAFLLVLSIVLCLIWFSQIVPFFIDGQLPPMIEKANTPTVFVFVLDLGVVVPLSVLSAWWLLNNRLWGQVLPGFVLVKSGIMGCALLSMTVFALSAGQEAELALSVVSVALAATGTAMSLWFFGHCRKEALALPG